MLTTDLMIDFYDLGWVYHAQLYILPYITVHVLQYTTQSIITRPLTPVTFSEYILPSPMTTYDKVTSETIVK